MLRQSFYFQHLSFHYFLITQGIKSMKLLECLLQLMKSEELDPYY